MIHRLVPGQGEIPVQGPCTGFSRIVGALRRTLDQCAGARCSPSPSPRRSRTSGRGFQLAVSKAGPTTGSVAMSAFYRALAKVAGPGRGRNADVAARRLAAHGLASRRLRGALLRGLTIAEVGQPEAPLDLTTDESTDAVFERLEEVARGMAASIDQIPLPMRRVVEKFRRNVYQGASGVGESGEVVFRSGIVNFLLLLLGGEIYDARPMAAMLGVDAAEIEPDAVDFINQRLRITMWEVDEAYRSAPLHQVVLLARWLRERAYLAVSFLGLETATESQLDDLAALFAPYAWHILGVISSRFDDAEQFVARLELPVVLAVPELSAPPISA